MVVGLESSTPCINPSTMAEPMETRVFSGRELLCIIHPNKVASQNLCVVIILSYVFFKALLSPKGFNDEQACLSLGLIPLKLSSQRALSVLMKLSLSHNCTNLESFTLPVYYCF